MRICGSASFISSRTSAASRARAVERPQRVDARRAGWSEVRASCCSAGTTDLSCLRTSSCCAVSRHQPFGSVRCATSCAGVSVVHPRLRRCGAACRRSVSRQMRPCRTTLSSCVLIDALAQVGARPRPLRLLDDAAVHVGDVHRAVGRGRHVDGPEQRIGRADELRQRIDVRSCVSPSFLTGRRRRTMRATASP